MNFNSVVVRQGSDAESVTREVLKEFPVESLGIGEKSVIIKPNAGRMAGPGSGINTSPAVIGGILDYFLDAGKTDIAVAESPILGVKAFESLEISGIAEEARKRRVKIIDLDASGYETVGIPGGTVIKKLKVCRGVLNDSFIISVPVMKTHMHTQVSLGLKNMKGCLYGREKVMLHQLPPARGREGPVKPLDLAIADMSRILMPDFTIIDGTIAQEGMGPSAGSPVKLGLVIASKNCLAADSTAVRLMGFDPGSVHHLHKAIALQGKLDKRFDFGFTPMEIDPPDFLKWSVKMEPPPKKISLEYSNVIVEDRDSCSACLSTVLMFLKRYYMDFADYLSPGKPLRIAIGKKIGGQEKGTLLIGNCTILEKDGGIFIKGCPPVSSQIFKEIEKLYPALSKKGIKINQSL